MLLHLVVERESSVDKLRQTFCYERIEEKIQLMTMLRYQSGGVCKIALKVYNSD